MNSEHVQSTCAKARNPFTTPDDERRQIWDTLMKNDFDAFVAGSWSMVENDFWEEGFSGVDARKEAEPSAWRLTFPDLRSYRDEWLRQVREFAGTQLVGTSVLEFLYESASLDDIEISCHRAIARKKFDGQAVTTDGQEIVLRFQTLYQLVKRNGRWLIAGFVGYLPNPMPRDPLGRSGHTPW